MQTAYGVHGDCQRLDQRRLPEAQAIGQTIQNVGRQGHILG
jgi:hypothetical protein